jgi:hypothetical protein
VVKLLTSLVLNTSTQFIQKYMMLNLKPTKLAVQQVTLQAVTVKFGLFSMKVHTQFWIT